MRPEGLTKILRASLLPPQQAGNRGKSLWRLYSSKELEAERIG